jgi:hypothetical protein
VHHAEVSESTREDILGDLFQGGITYGEHAQYFTPAPICDLMAQLTVDDGPGLGRCFSDPCCGSGRMLLAMAKIKPFGRFIGQDADLRCVKITAINLALHNLYGYVIWGNSLSNERKLVYETGFNGKGSFARSRTKNCPRFRPRSRLRCRRSPWNVLNRAAQRRRDRGEIPTSASETPSARLSSASPCISA